MILSISKSHPYPRLLLLALMLTLLGGCGPKEQAPTAPSSKFTISDGWPKTITIPGYPVVTLEKPPTRIVSTSVTLTGTLLTIDAPLVASAGTQANTRVADHSGFFKQWSQIALQRNVQPLYQGIPNAEAVAKQKPDLIVVSATGGDSALKLYRQFSSIAPKIVINYDDKSWQQLARQLAAITDRQPQAEQAIEQYQQRLNSVRQQLALPPQPITAMTYYEDGRGANFWTQASAQGQVLTALGFSLSPLPTSIKNNHQMGQRSDIVPVNGEKFADAITGQSILLFAADTPQVSAVENNPFIAHLPAITAKQVYALGEDSFRLDFYSAMHLLDRLETLFSTR